MSIEGVAPADLERALKAELEALVKERGPRLRHSLSLIESTLVGGPPTTTLEILFAAQSRPGCIFGLRSNIWTDGLFDTPPDRLAYYFWLTIEEHAEASDLGLPPCVAGEVAWIAED